MNKRRFNEDLIKETINRNDLKEYCIKSGYSSDYLKKNPIKYKDYGKKHKVVALGAPDETNRRKMHILGYTCPEAPGKIFHRNPFTGIGYVETHPGLLVRRTPIDTFFCEYCRHEDEHKNLEITEDQFKELKRALEIECEDE